MAQSQLDQAIARRLQRDRQNFAPSTGSEASAPARAAEQPDTTSRMLDIERVRPNPQQARTDFAPESIAELAASLKRDGQLQPILVRPVRAGRASTWSAGSESEELPGNAPEGEQAFEIVMGERRWRAARSIGLAQIRATVREIDDAEMLRLSLVENIQREDLNAVDRARTLLQLKQGSPGLTWNDIATDLGLSRQSISNLVALLKLPPDIQDDIRAGHLTEKHARALRQLEGEEQKQLSEQIKARSISGEAALAQARALRGASANRSVGAGEYADATGATDTTDVALSTSAIQSATELLMSARESLPPRLTSAQKRRLHKQVAVARKYLHSLEAALEYQEEP